MYVPADLCASMCNITVAMDGRAMEDQQFNPAKLFVGGLGQQSNEDSLSAYFSQFGKIKDSVVITDRATGRSRGFGFVVFEEHSSVDACLHGRHNIDGISVRSHMRPHKYTFPLQPFCFTTTTCLDLGL